MAVGDAGAQTLPAWCPSAQTRHLGAGASLVDEDQALRVEIGLVLEPRLAPLRDVGAVLFGCVRGLF